MNDPIQIAHLSRARSALDSALDARDQREKAAAFIDAARAILRSGDTDMLQALRNCGNALVEKAAAHLVIDGDFDAASGAMVDAYLASISELSIIDALKRFGRALPAQTRTVVIASDAVGDLVAEGDPKPVRHLDLSQGSVDPVKAVGMVVFSEELANATDGRAEALFEAELAAAVARASNSSILDALTGTNPTTITSNGDPLNDLRQGLAAAAPSNGYVVAMPSGAAAALATTIEAGPSFTVRGGEFRPGIHVVAVDSTEETVVIPASRVALWDDGLKLRSARHATVDLRDDPEAEPERVNLWQNNLRGLLLERSWSLAQNDGVVVVQPPKEG